MLSTIMVNKDFQCGTKQVWKAKQHMYGIFHTHVMQLHAYMYTPKVIITLSKKSTGP